MKRIIDLMALNGVTYLCLNGTPVDATPTPPTPRHAFTMATSQPSTFHKRHGDE